MQAHPVLYSFRRCPYAIRARMTLKYASIICELREVVLNNKPLELMSISKKGTVPVLQFANGKVIDESLDVMLWALQQEDPEHWLNVEVQGAKSLIKENDKHFKESLDQYKYFQKSSEKPQIYYRRKAQGFLQLLECNLQKHQGVGLLSSHISLADVAIFPFIRQFAHVDWDWFSHSQYKKLISWLLNFENSQLFLSVMKKHKPWQENATPVLT